MGGLVSSGKSDYVERGDWFSRQGYNVKIPFTLNADAVADGNVRVYDLGRFSCSLPSANPNTLQRNNDIYEHIKKMKSASWSEEAISLSTENNAADCGSYVGKEK